MVLSGVNLRFRAKLEKAGIVQQLGDDGIVNSVEHAMQKKHGVKIYTTRLSGINYSA